jgi:hypothetical protein
LKFQGICLGDKIEHFLERFDEISPGILSALLKLLCYRDDPFKKLLPASVNDHNRPKRLDFPRAISPLCSRESKALNFLPMKPSRIAETGWDSQICCNMFFCFRDNRMGILSLMA